MLPCAINQNAFETYVSPFPKLRDGDLVVMENLSSYKGPMAWKKIKDAGAQLLFRPRYGLDFHPNEVAFAKLKVQAPKGRWENC